MAKFHTPYLALLVRQLAYLPPEQARLLMDRAEELYWQLDPTQPYPLEFLVFRVRGFRPEEVPDLTVTGKVGRRDLLAFVEELSTAIHDRADAYDPPPIPLPQVRSQLGVSVDSIKRYRRQGLFARRVVWADERIRIGFLPESVQQFVESRPGKLKRAAAFSRMDEAMTHRCIMRARRIRSRVEVSPFRVARHLAKSTGRSVETLRNLLLRHDKADPRVAIFPEHTPAISTRDQRIIYRAYRRGVSVRVLQQRFQRSRNVIYRAINLRRAHALRTLRIECFDNPTFDRPDAEEVILGAALPLNPGSTVVASPLHNLQVLPDTLQNYFRTLEPMEPLDRQTETMLFVRYNFLKHRAREFRDSLHRHHPRASILDRVETYLRQAAAVKQQLVQSHLRLVVSTARKHLAGVRPGSDRSLADYIGEGNLTLMEAIETFDPARGNRFSTYLTWALMKRFAPLSAKRRTASIDDVPEQMAQLTFADVESDDHLADVRELLAGLDDREQQIVCEHFGLVNRAGVRLQPRTFAEIAGNLGISAERARQIERQALKKLRERARQLDIAFRLSDAIAHP